MFKKDIAILAPVRSVYDNARSSSSLYITIYVTLCFTSFFARNLLPRLPGTNFTYPKTCISTILCRDSDHYTDAKAVYHIKIYTSPQTKLQKHIAATIPCESKRRNREREQKVDTRYDGCSYVVGNKCTRCRVEVKKME